MEAGEDGVLNVQHRNEDRDGPLTEAAMRAKLTPGSSSVPTKLSSYQSVVLRFSAPHW